MRKERILSSKTNLHGLLNMTMVCALSIPLLLLVLDLHAHKLVLPAAALGWRGACTQIFSSYFL